MSDKLITRGYFAANLPPMLAPNKCLGIDIPFEDIKFPMLLSTKFNGIRGTTSGGAWHSRTGKEIRMSPEVRQRFASIIEHTITNRVVMDGEFNSNSHNTVGQTLSILAGTIPMPDDFRFKCFYEMPCEVWNTKIRRPMEECLPQYDPHIPRLEIVRHKGVGSLGEFMNLIEAHKQINIEGFMLLDGGAYYKHNRCTVKEATLLKYKYYSDPEDGKVIGLIPRKERKAGVQRKYGAHGKAEQVHTKDSFQETDIAGCMIVQLEDGSIIHSPFPLDYTTERKQMLHDSFGTGMGHDIKGHWICFRRLACENRDKPIAIKQVQFRDSKD
jgi:hypothetical protein